MNYIRNLEKEKKSREKELGLLCVKLPSFKKSLESKEDYEIELKLLSSVVPKKHSRVRQYKSLQKYLSENYGINLIISSQKNDNKGQRKTTD